MKKKPIFKRPLFYLLLFAVFCAVYVFTGILRDGLESRQINVTVQSQSGVQGAIRVVQLSDLHSKHFGEGNSELLALIASKKPDLIVTTGDMIDVHATDLEGCVNLHRKLAEIAPTAFSLGNHEVARDDWRELIKRLNEVGAIPLVDNVTTIQVNGLPVRVGGIMRASELPELDHQGPIDILLCHMPCDPSVFAERGVGLVFSGHAHGGQARIPILHIPLYAHGEGLFPKYTSGLYTEDGVSMIVSRGLGNTARLGIRIPRVHNPPEIIVAEVIFE